jgi:hypothetical protein
MNLSNVTIRMPKFPVRRAALAALFFSAACQSAPSVPAIGPSPTERPDSIQVRHDIQVLASDSFGGRRTGTTGNEKAARYLSERLAAMRLEPAVSAPGCAAGCAAGYLRSFTASVASHAGPPVSVSSKNVVGIIHGTHPTLGNEYVVIGAHFDHLGNSTESAMDPGAGSAIRNGADDNASGTAAVLALARRLAYKPAQRSILVVLFSGEEQGLLGSAKFVEAPPVPVAKMTAMVNFDMVGRMRDDKLLVFGIGTAGEMRGVVESANTDGLKLSLIPDGTGPSDHSSFYLKQMPVLHLFTDSHEDYHRATDDVEKINIAGEVKVIDLAERIIRNIADRPQRLSYVRIVTATRSGGSPTTGAAYFGSIPDMANADETGMKLSGVSAGGPAEKAGFRAGDLIVEFGGKTVKNIYDYTEAIGAFKPGDEVTVIVLRGPAKERLAIKVTLGRRGG